MSPIETHVDWSASPAPAGERVVPSLSRPRPTATSASPQAARRGTLETLLGDSKLTAYDASGNDPYNTTGRYFRR